MYWIYTHVAQSFSGVSLQLYTSDNGKPFHFFICQIFSYLWEHFLNLS